MGGVADVLAVKLIAEIGDARRLHNAKALIAWGEIDLPPYESGQFVGATQDNETRFFNDQEGWI